MLALDIESRRLWVEDVTTTDTNPFAAMDPEMAANPQPVFSALRDTMPVMAVEGVGVVVSRRAEIEEVFRDPGTFTSNMSAVDLKNIRPLIPLQIDPPDHKKYRKILDPIFAPRQMALIAEPVTQLANELIDRFVDRDSVDFSREFSVPFPSLVFLTLLGLPLDQLARFVEMKDGIIRPEQVTGTAYGSETMQAYQQKTADSIYAYFEEVLDEREAQRRDDLLSRFLDVEVDGEKLERTEILDICFLFLIAGLDTVSATLDCMFAYLAQHPLQRQRLVDNPALIPAAIEEMLRWETPVLGVARVGDARHDPCRVPDPRRRSGLDHLELGKHRPRRIRVSRRSRLRPRPEPASGLRRRRPPLPRLAPCSSRVAHRPAGMAPTHPRLLRRARAQARLHACHQVHRPLSDGVQSNRGLTRNPVPVRWRNAANPCPSRRCGRAAS